MRSGLFILLFPLLLLQQGCTDQRARPTGSRAPRLATPDAGANQGCAAACQAKAPYLCVLDSQKRCVECTKDDHCKKNPSSLGSTCDAKLNICRCTDSADCAGKVLGSRCFKAPTRVPICGCEKDADCSGGRRCILSLYGAKVCAPPCKTDKDCPGLVNRWCDAASGGCLQCVKDAHCGGKYTPRCAKGRCVACTADAHCTRPGETRCDDGVCSGCAADAHCADGKSGGSRCLQTSLEPRRCACQADGDCKGSDHGPSCHLATGRCGCKADGDCKAAGLGVCAQPFIGALYRLCGKPCKAKTDCGSGLVCDSTTGRCGQCKLKADCASTSFAFCDAAAMRCVACLADSDCGGDTPLCDSTSGRCVACKTAAQCAGSALGPVCAAGACTCAVDKDCAGTTSKGARCVSHGGITRCGCAADADCNTSHTGPTCYTTAMRCSCKSSADCKAAPYTKCLLAYPGAKYSVCTKPCKTDNDCPDAQNSRCDAASGRCFPCTKSAHCAGLTWAKICNPNSHRCVECAIDKDCTTQTLGGTCKNTLCSCAKDADCAASSRGKLCDKYYRVCSCVAEKDCPSGKKCDKTTLGTKIKLCK